MRNGSPITCTTPSIGGRLGHAVREELGEHRHGQLGTDWLANDTNADKLFNSFLQRH